jgi:hypothetical protein
MTVKRITQIYIRFISHGLAQTATGDRDEFIAHSVSPTEIARAGMEDSSKTRMPGTGQ